MQTKKQSFIEALINVAIGFCVTLVFSPVIYWLCDVKVNMAQTWSVTFLFTILSVLRSYVVRRFFNHKHKPSTLS